MTVQKCIILANYNEICQKNVQNPFLDTVLFYVYASNMYV